MDSNKKMKFWSIVLLTINSIIGTGIFLSPGGVAKIAGSLVPFIYLCSALFAASLAIIIPMAFSYNMMGIMIISSVARFLQFIVVPLAVIAFYYGKTKENVIIGNKNFLTDVIISIISLLLTVVLLVKFNWKGQFSIKNSNGEMVLNMYAIAAMIIGYVVLPIIMKILKPKK